MNASDKILNFEKLVNLFSLFVAGTICLLVYQFVIFPEFGWKSGIRYAILLAGLFSYEAVILALASYYLSHVKKKFAESFQKNKKRYQRAFVAILILTYAISDGVTANSFLIFIRDAALATLTALAIPFVNKWLSKNGAKNKIQGN